MTHSAESFDKFMMVRMMVSYIELFTLKESEVLRVILSDIYKLLYGVEG